MLYLSIYHKWHIYADNPIFDRARIGIEAGNFFRAHALHSVEPPNMKKGQTNIYKAVCV